MEKDTRIIITGAAGSLGQNVIMLLREKGYKNLLALDVHHDNIATLRKLNPGLEVIETDLADKGVWQDSFNGGEVLLHFQARITGLTMNALERDNVLSTENCLEAAKKHGVKYIVHTSSSVVLASANDCYTITKKRIDIMREIKRIRKLKMLIIPIPYGLFKFLLDFYALFSKNPHLLRRSSLKLSRREISSSLSLGGIYLALLPHR